MQIYQQKLVAFCYNFCGW